MVQISFSEAEAVVSRIHNISWGKRTAFASRLKHLQKLGLPARPQDETGKRTSYDFAELLQFAVAVELAEFGMAPQSIVDLVLRSWDVALAYFKMSLDEDAAPLDQREIPALFVCQPDGLSDKERFGFLEVIATNTLANVARDSYRLIIINADLLLHRIITAYREDVRQIDHNMIIEDLAKYELRNMAELDSYVESVRGDPGWQAALKFADDYLKNNTEDLLNREQIAVGYLVLGKMTDADQQAMGDVWQRADSLSDEQVLRFIELGILRAERRSVAPIAAVILRITTRAKKTARRKGYVDPEA